MIINKNVISNLTKGNRFKRAESYVKNDKVKIKSVAITDDSNFSISSEVSGSRVYTSSVTVKDNVTKIYDCTCPDCIKNKFMCKHIMATILEIYNKDVYKDMSATDIMNYSLVREKEAKKRIDELAKEMELKKKRQKYEAEYNMSMSMFNQFYSKIASNDEKVEYVDDIENGTVHLEPKLEYDTYRNSMKLSIKIGVKQMYRVKDFTRLLDNMEYGKIEKYGAKLTLKHTREKFNKESLKLLDFIIKNASHIKYAIQEVENNTYYYSNSLVNKNSICLTGELIDEFFDIYKGKSCEFNRSVVELVEEQPKLRFELKKEDTDMYRLEFNGNLAENDIIDGKEYKYIVTSDLLYRCSKNMSNGEVKLLETFKDMHRSSFLLSEEQLTDFYILIAPKCNDNITTKNVPKQEIEKYKPKELGVKLFLDINNKNNITAKLMFCYGKDEIDCVKEQLGEEVVKIPRNIIKENEVISRVLRTGFAANRDNKNLELVNEEQIYNFLSGEIEDYMKDYEVLATDKFKEKQIRRANVGKLGIRVENNLLNIDISGIDIDNSELKELMSKYSLKKKYHRLKDGSFIQLEDDENLEFLNNLTDGMDIDYKELTKGKIKVPIHRSLYLEKLLEKNKNIDVTKNKEYSNIVDRIEKNVDIEEVKVPQELENTLRTYQKTGFRWLKGISDYKFGGILADDMGLGKTLQIITLLTSYLQNEDKKTKKASIVVSPSSLAYNWKNEVNKFSPNIKVMVISGKAQERKELIEKIPKYDLIITSYDLLKRDIDVYQELDYTFKYIIADEAQYAKNSNTQNSTALKKLNSEVKFALTGTPIENSVSELWSIFDFCMPGYLFSYNKFKKNFESPIVKDNDEGKIKKLKMMIQPFILRRLKKEVLLELPDKTITILTNRMDKEQTDIYLAFLSQAKKDIAQEISDNGFDKSRVKILSIITRLRQICCHPGLFLEDYKGRSSKLEQCMEVLKDTIENGHKVLIFSQFTSIFPYMEDELNKNKIKYFKLTGSTKVDERIELVDKFNTSEEVKVFLISLKAGGTGLNLTGADVVMHYDPWWNLSAENQATDRTYRIGQKNNVQVYKFITENSIEEKINELQERKAKLSENLLQQGEKFIDKLTKEDIMALFD